DLGHSLGAAPGRPVSCRPPAPETVAGGGGRPSGGGGERLERRRDAWKRGAVCATDRAAMPRIACKFGGTSVARAAQIRKVRAVVEGDSRRQVVVVSAPRKRDPKEAKITDLLYLCQEMAEMKTDFSGPFGTVRERFLEIERELGVQADIGAALDVC